MTTGSGVTAGGLKRGQGAMNERGTWRDDEARRTAALMGFALVLALAIAGVILVRELRNNASLEDCLMAGRRNCAPIEAPLRRP